MTGCSYGSISGYRSSIMQNNGALWKIDPDAVAGALRVHILISSSIGCLDETTVILINIQFLFNLGI